MRDICKLLRNFVQEGGRRICLAELSEAPTQIPERRATSEEFGTASKHLKNRKIGAGDGLVAEMLERGHHGLEAMFANFPASC